MQVCIVEYQSVQKLMVPICAKIALTEILTTSVINALPVLIIQASTLLPSKPQAVGIVKYQGVQKVTCFTCVGLAEIQIQIISLPNAL